MKKEMKIMFLLGVVMPRMSKFVQNHQEKTKITRFQLEQNLVNLLNFG